MASVHLARMDGPGGFQKWVAIKRIHPHLVEDDQFVDMFLDEARIAAGINHANVAQVFDLGKDDNTYWIAMEYLHGEPLREVMRQAEDRRMTISPELAARICADAAEGLHAAHELRGKNGQLLGLVHRDVTPHNLFVTYDGYTKVVDFGIAKVADRLASTRAGTLKGKLAYMSPEQVRGSDVDRTTDIFALGVVLWELTTNQRLFRMDTDLDTLEKVQACNVPPPSSIIRGYPPGLEQVVLKALAKDKRNRFQTGREFSRALQGFLMQRGSFVGPEEVSQFVRSVFNDRIAKREAHLAWAAEVTSTVNIDQLRAQQGGGGSDLDSSLLDDDEDKSRSAKSKSAAQPIAKAHPNLPSPNERSSVSGLMAADSLMDDDEDIPTTVATREHMEKAAGAGFLRTPMPSAGDMRQGPKPAAGASAYAVLGLLLRAEETNLPIQNLGNSRPTT
jgi:serine/threonine-protein kinase